MPREGGSAVGEGVEGNHENRELRVPRRRGLRYQQGK